MKCAGAGGWGQGVGGARESPRAVRRLFSGALRSDISRALTGTLPSTSTATSKPARSSPASSASRSSSSSSVKSVAAKRLATRHSRPCSFVAVARAAGIVVVVASRCQSPVAFVRKRQCGAWLARLALCFPFLRVHQAKLPACLWFLAKASGLWEETTRSLVAARPPPCAPLSPPGKAALGVSDDAFIKQTIMFHFGTSWRACPAPRRLPRRPHSSCIRARR